MSTKVAKILSYFGIVGWLIAFLAGPKEDAGVKQHLNQALIPDVIAFIPVIGYLVWFVFFIMGILRAVKEDDTPLPVFGGIQIIK